MQTLEDVACHPLGQPAPQIKSLPCLNPLSLRFTGRPCGELSKLGLYITPWFKSDFQKYDTVVYFKYYYLKNILSPKNVRGLRRQRLRLTKVAGSIQVGKKRPASPSRPERKQQPGPGSTSSGPPPSSPRGTPASPTPSASVTTDSRASGGRLRGESGHLQPALPARTTPSGRTTLSGRPRDSGLQLPLVCIHGSADRWAGRQHPRL